MEEKDIKRGSQVRVIQKVTEGKKERLVSYTGNVMSVRGTGMDAMVTVRQMLDNIAVDRIFPLRAPVIVKVEAVVDTKKKTTTSKKRKKR